MMSHCLLKMILNGKNFDRKRIRIFIIFILSLHIILLSPPITRAETHWAVLVGIDKYQSLEITSLRGAANDAKSLAEVLRKDLGFPERNVFVYTADAPAVSQPNTGNIIKGLKYVAGKARSEDTFVLFFAGHGIVSGGKGYLLTQQSDLGAVEYTSLRLAELSQLVDSIKAGRKLLLVDACRNDPEVGRGDAPNRLSSEFARGISIQPATAQRKSEQVWATLFSCEEGQRAYEWPDRNRGFFTYYLEKGLKGDAVDSSGRVTLSSLVGYLRRVVPEEVQRTLGVDKRQVPWVKMEGADPGNWVITGLKADELRGKVGEKEKELGQLEKEYQARRAREQEEEAKYEAKLRKLDDDIAEMKKRLGTSLAKSGDSLDAMLAMVKQKEAEEKRLEELRKKRELEEIKRRVEIENLKAEKMRKQLSELKEDIRKYKEIVGSPYGKDLKEAAWKSLVSKYPDAADGVPMGDTNKLLFIAQYGNISPLMTNSIGMKFMFIPAGKFAMGSPEQWKGRWEDDGPPHEVEITKPFFMSQYEVTQGQWKSVMGSNPSHFKDCGDQCPVENVSWNDVQEFIRRLNQKEGGRKYRLPTEAEWEYACRAGAQSTYSFGDDEEQLQDFAWYDKNSGGKTHHVGRKKPNAWGLYDMHGNVWEWVQDWYDRNYYKNSPGENPRGPDRGESRVVRGGSWMVFRGGARASYRLGYSPDSGYYVVGFRLILPVE